LKNKKPKQKGKIKLLELYYDFDTNLYSTKDTRYGVRAKGKTILEVMAKHAKNFSNSPDNPVNL
jgi:hypothetical protein